MFLRQKLENARYIDTRTEAEYRLGHLPGAVRLDLTEPRFRLRDEEELQAFQEALAELNGALGLSPEIPVVCYDEGLTGQLARTAFLLALAGNEVFLWTEGWQNEATDTIVNALEATRPWVRFQETLLLTADQAQSFKPLFDVRTKPEYTGEVHPPCCPRGGRIPGARHAPLELFFEPDGLLKKLELEPGQEVGGYCHSGTRSAVAFWVLKSLGVNARNYLGSMHEWSRETDLPVEVDPPPRRGRRKT